MAVDLDASGATVVSAEAHKQIDLLRRWDVTGAARYLRACPVPDLPPGGRSGACLAKVSSGRRPRRVHALRGSPQLADSYVFLDVAQRRFRVAPLPEMRASGYGTRRPGD